MVVASTGPTGPDNIVHLNILKSYIHYICLIWDKINHFSSDPVTGLESSNIERIQYTASCDVMKY